MISIHTSPARQQFLAVGGGQKRPLSRDASPYFYPTWEDAPVGAYEHEDYADRPSERRPWWALW